MKNIVLIGMPGSGKTSVGKRLARELCMPLIDTDEMIERHAGQTISTIFAEKGEAWFRDLESRCAREAAEHEGTIISTGGGMVLRQENVKALAENGVIVFIDRHPSHILRGVNLSDRPLVQADAGLAVQKIWAQYRDRLATYRACAHHCVRNAGRIRQVVLSIVNLYKQR